MPVYVVDANFFIQAHRSIYPLDVAHSFWDKVKELAQKGELISIDKVKREIYLNEDALKHWCEANLPYDFFKDTSGVMNEYAQVVGWASGRPNYLQKALSEFFDANEADAFLAAYCLANPSERIITTQEIPAPTSKNKVKLPDACNALGVSYCNTIEMLRKLQQTF